MSTRPKAPEAPPPVGPTFVRRAHAHSKRIAVVGSEGLFTYRDLLSTSECVARRLTAGIAFAGGVGGARASIVAGDLGEARIAYLVPPGFHHVAVQWGVWRAGGVAVPLAVSHPPAELSHVIADAEPAAVVASSSLVGRIALVAEERGLPILDPAELCAQLGPDEPGSSVPEVASNPSTLPDASGARRALMVYTSGTTGRPKGVVTTHANLEAQVTSLVEAWEWSPDDHVLLVLPLHHVHGLINVVMCALWSGACCQMLTRFDATETWNRFARGDVTLFMAVPTVYVRLIRAWEEASTTERERWSEGARQMRLMVSGSAALPVSVLERWRDITGHVLLERYGMTEIGMGLSNPLRGERRPGYVGQPLPGVQVRRVDEAGEVVSDAGASGELQVRGPGVFLEYWRRPDDTERSFHDGWFGTGDLATEEAGCYRLLGRMSVDIIKTGGFKVSALQVEETLREHEDVEDCAVVGVSDAELGERLCVALVAGGEATLDPDVLLAWAKERLAPYKVPRELEIVTGLPRNAMGKVQKQDVKTLFETENPA